MKLIVDSREKWTQSNSSDVHLRNYFEKHSIEYEVRKLDVGDYQLEGNPGISVDRKQSMEEISRNLLNKSDSSRFWKEVRRAHDQHIKLVVLIESGPAVLNINQVAKWRSKYSGAYGRNLIDVMIRLECAYGVTFKFCSKKSTAKAILDILTEGH